MQVILPKNLLLSRLEEAASVADRKSASEATHRVCLRAGEGAVDLRGTDLTRSMSCAVGGEGVEILLAGTVALPAKGLLDRVKYMPDGPVELTMDGSFGVTVKAVGGQRRYHLPGIPGTEFPRIPDRGAAPVTLTLPAATMADLIARVKTVVSTDETRPHINSALWELFEGRMRMVATDGHRATYAERAVPSLVGVQVPTFGNGGSTLLVPLKGLGDIAALGEGAGAEEMTVTVVVADAFFQVGGTVLSVRLTDATFPPYRQVFGGIAPKPVVVPRAAMIEHVNAVAVAASDKTGGIKLTVRGGMIVFEATDPDNGAGHDELPVDYDGPVVTVGVAAKYLVDALRGMDPGKGNAGTEADVVRLSITGELDPIRIDPGTVNPDLTIVSVVMPMRI